MLQNRPPLNLLQRIAAGEDGTLEFKRQLDDPAKIAKTLVAFANTAGGTLLVGVADDGRICGVESEQTVLQLLETASDACCEPPLLVCYEVLVLDGRKVVAVTVPESDQKPHLVREASGEATLYVRMHDKSVPSGRHTARALAAATPPDKATVQSPAVKNLLNYLKTNEYITAKRCAMRLNISDRRAARLLADLTAQGVMIPVERGKDVVYTAPARTG